MERPRKTIKERFFKNKFSQPSKDACWIWHRAHTKAGYGVMYIKSGYAAYAHRLSYELHSGPIPKGVDVCHHCDTPACVNPKHLFLGTAKDNALDMVSKGRAKNETHIGELNGNSRFDEKTVLKIRKMLELGESGASIARKIGCCQTTISAINRRKVWKHI